MEQLQSILFWLLFFRIFVFDGLCVIPVNPVSWAMTHVGRYAKHNFKGPIYQHFLSHYFDSEATPLLWLLLISVIFLRKESTKNISKWKWLLLFILPFVLFHRTLLIHQKEEVLLGQLHRTFPSKESGILISRSSAFNDVESIFQSLHSLQKPGMFSWSKAISNHFGSQQSIPHCEMVLYKTYKPKPETDCSNEIFHYLGLSSLANSRKNQDLGELYLEYYSGQEHSPTKANKPLVVFVHGGGWKRGEKRTFEHNYMGGGFPRLLIKNGISVAAISYRLVCTGYTGYDMIEDIQDAIFFMQQNAERFGIDPSRIILMGASAGGHLSLLTSLRSNIQGLLGVISLYAPIESREAVAFASDQTFYEKLHNYFYFPTISNLCKGLDEAPCLEDMSVVSNAKRFGSSKSPPALMIHGHNDPIVPINHAYWGQKALTDAGIKNVLVDIPCASHDCDIICSSACSQMSLYSLETFLNALL